MKPITRKRRKNDVFCLGPNMCYVNYNLPRSKLVVISVLFFVMRHLNVNLYYNSLYISALPMNQYEVKKLIKDGNVQILEDKLLNGEGYKLMGHFSSNPKIKMFLQSVPIYIVNI